MTIKSILQWHQFIRPKPTADNLRAQFAAHVEEFVEMMDSVHLSRRGSYARQALHEWCEALKKSEDSILIKSKEELLDSLADQIVTAVGVGHCAAVDVPAACVLVNQSNYSKFDDNGDPIFNEQGKLIKGPHYFKVDLKGLY